MKTLKISVILAAFALCVVACTNNNSNTGGIDSTSVSTDPSMGGSPDTGISSSDSTDIRMPMLADSSGNNKTSGSSTPGAANDSSMHR